MAFSYDDEETGWGENTLQGLKGLSCGCELSESTRARQKAEQSPKAIYLCTDHALRVCSALPAASASSAALATALSPRQEMSNNTRWAE
eukprot:6132335-Prymnesium_polylepis.1